MAEQKTGAHKVTGSLSSALEQLAAGKAMSPCFIGAFIGIVCIILAIQVESGLALYTVVQALFGRPGLAALAALVFVVLDLGILIVGRLLWRRILYQVPLGLWLAMVSVVAGSQVNRDSLVKAHYVHWVEDYAHFVAEHRSSELAAAAILLGCESIGEVKMLQPCAAMQQQHEEIVNLSRPLQLDGEDPFQYCIRIYKNALHGECRVLDHAVQSSPGAATIREGPAVMQSQWRPTSFATFRQVNR